MEDPVFRIDESRIISEVLDGETVIIDFKNGSYYSLNQTGSALWEQAQKGHRKSQIIAHLAERFDAPLAVIEKSAADLLSLLTELSLVTPETTAGVPAPAPYTGEKQPFLALGLQQFQDMQEMLLADPIHDVNETGWPSLKQ